MSTSLDGSLRQPKRCGPVCGMRKGRTASWKASELCELADQHCPLGNKWTSIKIFHKADAQVKNTIHRASRSKGGFEKCPVPDLYARRVERCAHDPEARRAALRAAQADVKSRTLEQSVVPEARSPSVDAFDSGCQSDLGTDLDTSSPKACARSADGVAPCSVPSSSAPGMNAIAVPVPYSPRRPAGADRVPSSATTNLGVAASTTTLQAQGCAAPPRCPGAASAAGAESATRMKAVRQLPYCAGGGEPQAATQPPPLRYDPARDPLLLLREHTRRASELSAVAELQAASMSLLSGPPSNCAPPGTAAGVVGGAPPSHLRLILPRASAPLPGPPPAAPAALWNLEDESPFVHVQQQQQQQHACYSFVEWGRQALGNFGGAGCEQLEEDPISLLVAQLLQPEEGREEEVRGELQPMDSAPGLGPPYSAGGWRSWATASVDGARPAATRRDVSGWQAPCGFADCGELSAGESGWFPGTPRLSSASTSVAPPAVAGLAATSRPDLRWTCPPAAAHPGPITTPAGPPAATLAPGLYPPPYERSAPGLGMPAGSPGADGDSQEPQSWPWALGVPAPVGPAHLVSCVDWMWYLPSGGLPPQPQPLTMTGSGVVTAGSGESSWWWGSGFGGQHDERVTAPLALAPAARSPSGPLLLQQSQHEMQPQLGGGERPGPPLKRVANPWW